MSTLADLDDRTALVTGSSRGIGRAIAVALAEAGCHVAVHYHVEEEKAEETADRVAREGRGTVTLQADVSDAGECEDLLTEAVDEMGTLDILVNNAGIAEPIILRELTAEDWQKHVDTNLSSVFHLTQGVVEPMRKQHWGRIINISSVAARMGGLVGPHYAATKAGILGMTRAYASWLSKAGVTVNAIAPALIDTDMVPSEEIDPNLTPVGRFGEVEEPAEVAVMLARNGYITGQTINVDGGIYLT